MARLAWLLSLLAIATSAVHLGVVRHERCLEHGELVEVHRGSGAHEADTGVSIAALGSGDEHDEHCPLANAPTTAASTSPLALALDRPAALAVPAFAPPSTAHASVAALHLAPKQGPPVRTA